MLKPVLAVVMTLALTAAPQPQRAGTGSVAGRVLDAATGQPVSGATVWLIQARGGSLMQSIKTDAQGTFSFSGASAGSFSIDAHAETYLRGAVGKRRVLGDPVWISLTAGERRDDLVIPMFKAAVLSGRVVDEHGKPRVDFWVEAWPKARRPSLMDEAGRTESARTDGDGVYRIKNLVPGDYVVVARVSRDTIRQRASAPAPCGLEMPPLPRGMRRPDLVEKPDRPVGSVYTQLPRALSAPKALANGTAMTYRTLFYPAAFQMAEAATISVGSGEFRAGLDFQLLPVAATKVSGELKSPQGFAFGGEVRLRLVGDPQRDGSEVRTWLERGNGAFTLLDVPAGKYFLEPTRISGDASCDVLLQDPESKLTSVELDVPPTGLDGVIVPLVRSASVTGSIVLKGATKPPEYIDVGFLPLEPARAGIPPIPTVANDRLTVGGVLPGAYELHASDNATTASWWLQSVTAGGRDVTGLPLVVGADGVNDLVVVMTDRPSPLRGTVNTPAKQLVDDATVVLFPVDRATWTSARLYSLRFQTSRALRGVYAFDNVPAGEYFIAAVDETTMDPWPAAGFLQRIAPSAMRVTVKQATGQTIALTLGR